MPDITKCEGLIVIIATCFITILGLFHETIKQPAEQISDSCLNKKVYHDAKWPWRSHVKCIDDEDF